MAIPNPARIGEQNEAYRKGLVLGLTMAEVGILIIFVLLLLLAFGELRRLELVRKFLDKEPIHPAQLAELTAAKETLQEIAKELGLQAQDEPEDFTRLVRVIREATQAQHVKSVLMQATSGLKDIQQARQILEKAAEDAKKGGGEAIAKRVEQQSFQLANKDGQLTLLQNKLVAAGQGKGERPCWVQLDGTIDYLYDVVLTSRGIKMREHVHPHRQRERELLRAPAVDPRELVSEAVFLARTRPLFDYSRQNDCRFFVVIYDATASHEKPLYKNLLRTVEGHFYKRLDNGLAPF